MDAFIQKVKPWAVGALKSWTVWFNAVGIPLLIYLEGSVALWQEHAGGYTNEIIIIINVLLRLKTNTTLKDK